MCRHIIIPIRLLWLGKAYTVYTMYIVAEYIDIHNGLRHGTTPPQLMKEIICGQMENSARFIFSLLFVVFGLSCWHKVCIGSLEMSPYTM